jgi:hypothetical protein
MSRCRFLLLTCILLAGRGLAAGEAQIVFVDMRQQSEQAWRVAVTLRHDDTGWQHYADAWRVVDERGRVLASRVLHHPHVHEQPFTRSLPAVLIPHGLTRVLVEAHDNVHGWSTRALPIELNEAGGERFNVTRR